MTSEVVTCFSVNDVVSQRTPDVAERLRLEHVGTVEEAMDQVAAVVTVALPTSAPRS